MFALQFKNTHYPNEVMTFAVIPPHTLQIAKDIRVTFKVHVYLIEKYELENPMQTPFSPYLSIHQAKAGTWLHFAFSHDGERLHGRVDYT